MASLPATPNRSPGCFRAVRTSSTGHSSRAGRVLGRARLHHYARQCTQQGMPGAALPPVPPRGPPVESETEGSWRCGALPHEPVARRVLPSMSIDQVKAKRMLDLAARLATRAAGWVEPNPLVGCVIEKDGRVLGMGHHRRFGDVHAEVDALNDCRDRNESPAGATVYVTLEPCNAAGKQPSCVDALIAAKVGAVVCARRDPHPMGVASKSGGADRLRVYGIPVEFTDVSPAAIALSDPFVKRLTTGMPWVIAKWAQSIDGRAATRTGESKWISSERSRSRVHRLRARVDAIVTAIGTVMADDPTLTARGGWTRRKVARRVVIDPDLEILEGCSLFRTLAEAPLTIVCSDEAIVQRSNVANTLAARGVEVISLGSDGEIDLTSVFTHLAGVHMATNVLVEAGPGLVGRLLDHELVDELWVYVAPMVMGDEQAKPVARGRVVNALSDAKSLSLDRVKRLGDDMELVYRRRVSG